MKRFASLMNGEMAIRANFILQLILVRLSSWLKNTVADLIRAVSGYNYRGASDATVWFLRERWNALLDRFPARRELYQWRNAYWALYDEWEKIDHDYRNLYAKHIDLNDELRYWETRHAKVLNYIEKHMEMDQGGK